MASRYINHLLKGYLDLVNTMVFLLEKSKLVLGLNNNTIQVWDIVSKQVNYILKSYLDLVNSRSLLLLKKILEAYPEIIQQYIKEY